jgi:hypothetical protein
MYDVKARLNKISLTKTEGKATESDSKKDNYKCIKTWARIKSQRYVMTDGQLVSLSWCQAPIWGL